MGNNDDRSWEKNKTSECILIIVFLKLIHIWFRETTYPPKEPMTHRTQTWVLTIIYSEACKLNKKIVGKKCTKLVLLPKTLSKLVNLKNYLRKIEFKSSITFFSCYPISNHENFSCPSAKSLDFMLPDRKTKEIREDSMIKIHTQAGS